MAKNSVSKSLNKSPTSKKPTKKARESERAAAAAANARYVELSEKLDGTKAQPYRMASVYTVESKIEHPKFGVGFVVASVPNKIEVVFEDISRQLVQGRK